MKLIIGIAALLVILAIGYTVFGSSKETGVTMDYNTIQASGALFDVRTSEEFADGHIKEATNLPLGDIQNGTYPKVDSSTPIYVYCRSGSRSAMATTLLQKAGFTNVTDLGAINSVVALGGEVVK